VWYLLPGPWRTPLRAADIKQALGVRQARMVLKRMADAGVLERVAKGEYAITEGED
jgi:hypothetical protein